MDRLKYRVWAKRLNRYLGNNDPTQMLLENGNLAYLDDEGMKFYKVEFCTGLKDKNGKLIYEGDICRITGKYYDCTFEEWIDVDTTEEIKSLEQFFGEAMVKGVYSALGCDTLNVEVIGNIHENADLLGDTTNEI